MVKLTLTQGSLKSTERDLDITLMKPDLFFKLLATDASGINDIQFTRDGLESVYELGIISVKNTQYSKSKGNNLFSLSNNEISGVMPEELYTDLIGNLQEDIVIQQSYLESSNVDISKEMTDLITAQRLYQFQARSVTLAD